MEIPYKTKPDGSKLALAKNFKEVEISPEHVILSENFRTFDVPIKFTVAGQLVTQELIVRKRPVAIIRITAKELIFDRSNRVKVGFKLDNRNNYNERLYSYFWQFGDGKTSKTMEPVHTFVAPKNTKPGEVVTYETKVTFNGTGCKEIAFTLEVDVIMPEER